MLVHHSHQQSTTSSRSNSGNSNNSMLMLSSSSSSNSMNFPSSTSQSPNNYYNYNSCRNRTGNLVRGCLHLLPISLILNGVLFVALLRSNQNNTFMNDSAAVTFIGPETLLQNQNQQRQTSSSLLSSTPVTFHGGHPLSTTHTGNCYCNDQPFCLCTPNLAIDLIIVGSSATATTTTHDNSVIDNKYVWLVKRKDTNQLAVMGGFVDVGESTTHAVHRELLEETGIQLPSDSSSHNKLQFFGLYDDPRRDNRRHTVSAVYVVQLDANVHPKAADDVKDVIQIPLADVENHDYFADHYTILMDYKKSLLASSSSKSITMNSNGDFANDIHRSLCSNK